MDFIVKISRIRVLTPDNPIQDNQAGPDRFNRKYGSVADKASNLRLLVICRPGRTFASHFAFFARFLDRSIATGV